MPDRNDSGGLLLSLELLKRIPRSSKITSSELGAQLAAAGIVRTPRTIQRQLEALCQQFDIERDVSSRPYGYRWKPGSAALALPVLSEAESLLLAMAEQQLAHLLPAKLFLALNGFFRQARANLMPHTSAHGARDWLGKVRVVSVSQPLLPPPVAPGVFEEVSNALYANRWLQISYITAHARAFKSKVMPLGLAQQGPRMYLVCRFEGFDEERSLALHRMKSALALDTEFERPSKFDLARFDADGRFGFGEGNHIRVTFRISKEAGAHLLETPLSKDQKITKIGENFKVSATVIDSMQLQWWLQSFGKEVSSIRKVAARGVIFRK